MRIALFQPDIPQNTGTVLRLAACLGVEVHIIEPAGFPSSDRAFRRAVSRRNRSSIGPRRYKQKLNCVCNTTRVHFGYDREVRQGPSGKPLRAFSLSATAL